MGQKQHPLDVFRTSESGFGKATRRRRVQGKVLASTARPTQATAEKSRGPGLLGGFQGGDAVLVRRAAYGAFAVLLVVGLVWSVDHFTSPGNGDYTLPTLSINEAMGGAEANRQPADAGPAPNTWTITAATYNGTHMGQAMAENARDELLRRGWSDVLVLGHPRDDDPNAMKRFELVLGVGSSADALAADLAELRALSDWPHGDPSPFLKARIVPHPLGEL